MGKYQVALLIALSLLVGQTMGSLLRPESNGADIRPSWLVGRHTSAIDREAIDDRGAAWVAWPEYESIRFQAPPVELVYPQMVSRPKDPYLGGEHLLLCARHERPHRDADLRLQTSFESQRRVPEDAGRRAERDRGAPESGRRDQYVLLSQDERSRSEAERADMFLAHLQERDQEENERRHSEWMELCRRVAGQCHHRGSQVVMTKEDLRGRVDVHEPREERGSMERRSVREELCRSRPDGWELRWEEDARIRKENLKERLYRREMWRRGRKEVQRRMRRRWDRHERRKALESGGGRRREQD